MLLLNINLLMKFLDASSSSTRNLNYPTFIDLYQDYLYDGQTDILVLILNSTGVEDKDDIKYKNPEPRTGTSNSFFNQFGMIRLKKEIRIFRKWNIPYCQSSKQKKN